jgi:hypothetical protein
MPKLLWRSFQVAWDSGRCRTNGKMWEMYKYWSTEEMKDGRPRHLKKNLTERGCTSADESSGSECGPVNTAINFCVACMVEHYLTIWATSSFLSRTLLQAWLQASATMQIMYSLLWDVTQCWLTVRSACALKMGPIGCPETSVIINQRGVNSQKSEDLNSTSFCHLELRIKTIPTQISEHSVNTKFRQN